MKKITYLLIALTAALSVASCVKELTPEPALTGDGVTGQGFTVSLPAATRTALADGKTVWAKGDSIWVSNGAETEAVVVPEAAWGQKEFDFATKTVKTSEETPQIYVVYPYSAAAGVKDGKVSVTVPAVQDGLFENANIAAAVSWGYHVELKNVTGVFKVTVPDDAVLYSIAFSAAGGKALAGTCAVDFSGEAPVLTPTTSSSAITVPMEGLTGDMYVSVIPGTFDAGFSLTAAGYSFEAASEVKESKVANTVAANDLLDLGVIGSNLGPLSGEGTESSPWLIENLGHMVALAIAVNEGGESFAGKYFKVINDINGITMPVGYFPNADTNHPFQGDFDGGNHTLTLNINGADQPSQIRLGLFGALNAGANIHDLVIAGQVTSTKDAIGGLTGRIDVPAEGEPVKITNVINKADVSGPNYIAGLVAYATVAQAGGLVITNCSNEGTIKATGAFVGGIGGSLTGSANMTKTITHCTNTGAISGTRSVAGICGYAYFVKFDQCINSADVTSSQWNGAPATYGKSGNLTGAWATNTNNGYANGAGGIAGWAQNSSLTDCTNSGKVIAPNKVGGISGAIHFTPVTGCTNSGEVYANNKATTYYSGLSTAGGIVGWVYVKDNVVNCTNTGYVHAAGGLVGGIVGALDIYPRQQSTVSIKDCINSGAVGGNGNFVGGIAGRLISSVNAISMTGCVNQGKVSNASSITGGLVGATIASVTASSTITIAGCVNEGEVQSMYRVGGICGATISFESGYGTTIIRDTENKGQVTSTAPASSSVNNQEGGIVGWCSNLTSAGFRWTALKVQNCLNSGVVRYSDADRVANLYVGGIVGDHYNGIVENSVNQAYVGPSSGAEAVAEGAEARLGALVGSVGSKANLQNSYYLAESCGQPAGTAGKAVTTSDSNNVRSYDRFANLNDWVGDFFLAHEALNDWVANAGGDYYTWNWNNGPILVKP